MFITISEEVVLGQKDGKPVCLSGFNVSSVPGFECGYCWGGNYTLKECIQWLMTLLMLSSSGQASAA